MKHTFGTKTILHNDLWLMVRYYLIKHHGKKNMTQFRKGYTGATVQFYEFYVRTSFQQLVLVKETMRRVNTWNRFMNILMYGGDQLINWILNRSLERVSDVSVHDLYVLIRCDSSHSCVWSNTHRYRFVLLVDLIVEWLLLVQIVTSGYSVELDLIMGRYR